MNDCAGQVSWLTGLGLARRLPRTEIPVACDA